MTAPFAIGTHLRSPCPPFNIVNAHSIVVEGCGETWIVVRHKPVGTATGLLRFEEWHSREAMVADLEGYVMRDTTAAQGFEALLRSFEAQPLLYQQALRGAGEGVSVTDLCRQTVEEQRQGGSAHIPPHAEPFVGSASRREQERQAEANWPVPLTRSLSAEQTTETYRELRRLAATQRARDAQREAQQRAREERLAREAQQTVQRVLARREEREARRAREREELEAARRAELRRREELEARRREEEQKRIERENTVSAEQRDPAARKIQL
jgi:flagellar biosynthesis GTPase FlhF